MKNKFAQSSNKMRVSFDLDEVLFVNPANHKTEPKLPFPLDRLYKERLRLGTAHLIPELQRQGFEVWIYTSSFRTDRYLKTLFGLYHVKFDNIVNGQRHQKEVQRSGSEAAPTKLPSRYQISLHIDDEAIVATYGKEFGFDVFQLDAQDDEWEEKIIQRVHEIKEKKIKQGYHY